MFRGSTWRTLNGLTLATFTLFSVSLKAQDAWQPVSLSDHGRPIPTLRAIGIKAVAECDGRTYAAHVIAWGRVVGGNYVIGVVINGFKDAISNAELDEFRGPDLSRKAISKDVISVEVNQNGAAKIFRTRLVMGATEMFPDSVRGDSEEYFETNIRTGKQESKKWAELLEVLSQGIGESRVTIGENTFSKKIVVRFGGEGVVPLAKDFIKFIAKK